MAGFLSEFFGKIIGIVQQWFAKVFDLVVGLSLFPFLGTFELFLELILQVICCIATLFSICTNGIVLFDSMRDPAVIKAILPIDVFNEHLSAFALALVFFVYIFQLMKSFLSPQASDTPIELTARFLFAGILIGGIRTVLEYFIGVFNELYTMFYQMLTSNGVPFANFNAFAILAQKWILEDDKFVMKLSATSQMLTILGEIFLIIMTVSLAFGLIKYLIEFVQRVVVLEILVVTSPLACALFVSNSTKRSASCWIRMVVSQMLLMCFSLMFLSLFYSAFSNFETAMTTLEASFSGENITLVFIWTGMVYAILWIGTRVDSYMKTIGLSTAETGRGVGAAIFSETQSMFNGFGMMYSTTSIFDGGGGGVEAAGAVGRMAAGAANYLRQTFPIFQGSGPVSPTGSVVNGEYRRGGTSVNAPSTVNGINNVVVGDNLGNAYRSGQMGQQFAGNLRGLPSELSSRIDRSSVVVSPGGISAKAYGGPDGKATTLSFIPIKTPEEILSRRRNQDSIREAEANLQGKYDLPAGGRIVQLGSQFYMMYGVGSMERQFATMNKAAYSKVKEFAQAQGYEKPRIHELKDEHGLGSGIYRITSIDKENGTVHCHEFIPDNRYEAVVPDGASVEQMEIGGLSYSVLSWDQSLASYNEEIHNPHEAFNMEMPASFEHAPDVSRARFLCEQVFPDSGLKRESVEDVRFGEIGVFTAKVDGKDMVFYPAAIYNQPENGISHPETIIASNGAVYHMCEIDSGEAGVEPSMEQEDMAGGPDMPPPPIRMQEQSTQSSEYNATQQEESQEQRPPMHEGPNIPDGALRPEQSKLLQKKMVDSTHMEERTSIQVSKSFMSQQMSYNRETRQWNVSQDSSRKVPPMRGKFSPPPSKGRIAGKGKGGAKGGRGSSGKGGRSSRPSQKSKSPGRGRK